MKDKRCGDKMTTIQQCIDNITANAIETELYKQMQQRKGQMAIHKGSTHPEILFIGEAPGQTEEKEGIPFIGKSGKILDKWIETIKEHKWAVINTVPIMPTNKNGQIRKPTRKEIHHFSQTTIDLITTLNPKYVILLGRSANEIWTKHKLTNGQWIQLKYHTGFIYHPSYYIRNGRDGTDDFKKLIEKIPKGE